MKKVGGTWEIIVEGREKPSCWLGSTCPIPRVVQGLGFEGSLVAGIRRCQGLKAGEGEVCAGVVTMTDNKPKQSLGPVELRQGDERHPKAVIIYEQTGDDRGWQGF